MIVKAYRQKRENVKEYSKGRICNSFGLPSAWLCVRFKTRTSEDSNSASHRRGAFRAAGAGAKKGRPPAAL